MIKKNHSEAELKKCNPFGFTDVISILPKSLRNQWHVSRSHFSELYLYQVRSIYIAHDQWLGTCAMFICPEISIPIEMS